LIAELEKVVTLLPRGAHVCASGRAETASEDVECVTPSRQPNAAFTRRLDETLRSETGSRTGIYCLASEIIHKHDEATGSSTGAGRAEELT
jgi:hypothetical protein